MRPSTTVPLALALLALLAGPIAGCASSAPGVNVVTYVRNASPKDVTLVTDPQPAAPVNILVAAGGLGGQCSRLTPGSQLLLTGTPPSSAEPNGRHLVAIIGAQDPAADRVVWVDVGADGAIETGQDRPSWWTASPVGCA